MSFDELIESLSEEQKQELLDALNSNPERTEEKAEKPFSAVSHSQLMKNGPVTTKIKKTKTDGEVTGVPVNEMPRFNKFTDNGSEHKDDQNETPAVELTERSRQPFKQIEQTCTRCNKTLETHPQFLREFYICDRCLKR